MRKMGAKDWASLRITTESSKRIAGLVDQCERPAWWVIARLLDVAETRFEDIGLELREAEVQAWKERAR